jgi:hypothetical protein
MFITPPPRTPMALYPGGYFGAGLQFSYAVLEITDWNVRCIVDGQRDGKTGYEVWLAQRLQLPDLKQRLKAGERVTVFEFPRNSYTIAWPKMGMGSVFQISQSGASPWTVALYRPPFTLWDYLDNKIRKQWRQALDSPERLASTSNPSPYSSPAAPLQHATPTSPPPGWYPDPAGAAGMQRYWDGARWNSTAQPRP